MKHNKNICHAFHSIEMSNDMSIPHAVYEVIKDVKALCIM